MSCKKGFYRPVTDQMEVGQHDHLKNLLVQESLSKITPGGGTGASQIRNVNRYGFFRIYQTIFNLIIGHLLDLNQRPNGDDIDVNIICSIAGGTGSGSLLDVILLLNAMKDDPNKGLGRLQINPIIVLPDVFESMYSDQGEWIVRVRATAYAVLSELDTLGVPNKPFIVELLNEKNPITLKENFKVEWMPSSYNNPTILSSYTVTGTTSLWNMCYLLSSANLPTGTVVNPAKAIGNNNADFKPGPDIANAMFQAISDFIYIKSDDDCVNGNVNPRNFPSEFLQNINNPIGTALTNSSITIGNDTFKFNNLYGSFGISKIYTDNEKLTQVSSLLLLRKYIDFKINAPSTKLPADIINESDVLKGWKIADIVNKLEKTEKGESIYGEIDKLCVVFKNNLDSLIKSDIELKEIFDSNKNFDFNNRNVPGKNIDALNIPDFMIKKFGILIEKLRTEVGFKVQKIQEKAVLLSIDEDPTNNDTDGVSFLESLNDFCLKALGNNNWNSVSQCFNYIYKNFYVSNLKEVIILSAELEKIQKNADKFAAYKLQMDDLKFIPKSQQGITCKAISETLVNELKTNCEKEILYQIYQAIEFKFLQRIKPYLDPEETSSHYQTIFNATEFLKSVSDGVSSKVSSALISFQNTKETAFSTPIINENISELFLEEKITSAIKSKFRNQNSDYLSFSQVEVELLDQLHLFPKTYNLSFITPNFSDKSLGSIFLGLVKRNVKFCAQLQDHFIENLRFACYLYLKNICKLGYESSVSEQFENAFAGNLQFVQDQVMKKSSLLTKLSATYTNLTYAEDEGFRFKYFLSSVDNTDFRNRHAGGGVTSNYRYFSRDANYFVDVKIIVPLVSLDCIEELELSYNHILNESNNSTIKTPIKAEYLHSDFSYFKYFSVPFTPDAINAKKAALKKITCILIESIILGIFSMTEDKIGFEFFINQRKVKFYFSKNIKTFGKLLLEIVKGSYERDLIENISYKYNVIASSFGALSKTQFDIKIQICLKYLRSKIEVNFKQVLKISFGDDIIEAKELQDFLLDCVNNLEEKYSEETKNDQGAIDAKREYDELLSHTKTNSIEEQTKAKLDFSNFLANFCKESFTEEIYIPVITF